MRPGKLFLVPAWLSEHTPTQAVVPAPALARIRTLDCFVVENARSARRFLAACRHARPMREIEMWELDENTAPAQVPALLAPALAGRDLGLMSEAGLPAVADPGALLVASAHERGIVVIPLVGPSSIMLGLEASGLEGQRFRFVGYLPAAGNARREAIAELERQSARHGETQIFIETPYRNDALLADLLQACRDTTRLCVGVDLTGPSERVRMETIAGWRRATPTIGKTPAIFLLLAAPDPRR